MTALHRDIRDAVTKSGGSNLTFAASDPPYHKYTYNDSVGHPVSDTGTLDTVQMIVAGIDADQVGREYSFVVPKGITLERDTQNCGAMWQVQTDVLSRIILGHPQDAVGLDLVKQALAVSGNTVQQQRGRLEYIINWGFITLQDAADFCILMTRMTESILRYADGTPMTPGGIAGVGGQNHPSDSVRSCVERHHIMVALDGERPFIAPEQSLSKRTAASGGTGLHPKAQS